GGRFRLASGVDPVNLLPHHVIRSRSAGCLDGRHGKPTASRSFARCPASAYA
ncbi:unnamed protein product, partial [Didymodactylos carnosus]